MIIMASSIWQLRTNFRQMKTTIFLLVFYFITQSGFSQKNKAIFLVHSTGTGLYSKGKVTDWVKTYNLANGTNFQITARTYPDTPWPWENYPYDYWKLWVNNNCDNSNPNIECLSSIASNYGLVIFKHCYPGASVNPDTGIPSISSSRKSLENYKLQYRALRTLMDGMPDKKFMVWTLVPLHRLATTTEEAARAYEFVKWVKDQWLTEDGKLHANIFIFDFYSLAAEMTEKPVNGKQYCLKYEYEGSHTSDDSHPNTLANQTIGPLFAQAVVNVLNKNYYITNISVNSLNGDKEITIDQGSLQMQASILPIDALSKSVTWSVVNLTGEATINSTGLLKATKNGTIKVVATATDGSGVKGELQITITNQKILIENISIIDNLTNDTIKGIGAKLVLKVAINPANATNQSIIWSVENLTGKATIDENGLLTTISQGTINVIAKATDESQSTFQKKYTIVIPVSVKNLPYLTNFNLFPNPTRDKIQLQIDKMTSAGVTVVIINTQGQILVKKRVFDVLTEWSIAQFSGNIFFVTVIDETSSVTKKIIVGSKPK
jgi:hypothetical protein